MKYILAIVCCALCLTASAQSFYVAKTLDTANCKLGFYNSIPKKFFEMDAKDLVFSYDGMSAITIKSGNQQLTIRDTLNAPTWSALPAYLISVQKACKNSGTTVSVTASAGSNDSAFSWKVTDSLTLNPLTYKSVSFSVTDGTATLRSGSRNTTDLPTGYSGSFTATGLLVERIRIIATGGGTVFVNATK